MAGRDVVGVVLVAGLTVFLVGAGGWRKAYEQPLTASLRTIHTDRRRRAWIHAWMIPAMFITCAGMVGLVVLLGAGTAAVVAAMAAVAYAIGAVCWIASLAFRLTVVPWAAERTVADGAPPAGFAALDGWAGSLYVVHMVSAYAASATLGAALLVAGELPGWVGWFGVGWGLAFLAGFLATRFAGPFNPPFWAHVYSALVGAMLLAT